MRRIACLLTAAVCANGSALGQSTVQDLVDAGAVRLGMKEVTELATGATMHIDFGINRLQLELSPDLKATGVYLSTYAPAGVWGTWGIIPSGHICYTTASSQEPNPVRRCLGIYLHNGRNFCAFKGSRENPEPPPTAAIFGVAFKK